MLLPKQLWDPIARGEVTLAFRRWRRPTVRAGGSLRSPAGRRKLKALGLTTSHRVGYSLTPRGRAFLAAEEASVEPRAGSQ